MLCNVILFINIITFLDIENEDNGTTYNSKIADNIKNVSYFNVIIEEFDNIEEQIKEEFARLQKRYNLNFRSNQKENI